MVAITPSQSLIRPQTQSYILTVGHWPTDIAVTPNGLKVYVCNTNDDTVSAIDAITNTVIGNPIPVGSWPNSIAITPDGSKAYVCNGDINTVSVIDTSTDRIVEQGIPVGIYPRDIAITPDGTKAYVCNASDGTVSVIDIATNTVVGIPIQVGSWPMNITITPNGSKAYVCNGNSQYISVIELANNSVSAIPVDAPTNCVAVTPDGAKAYATTSYSNFDIVRYNTSTLANVPTAVGGRVIVIDVARDEVVPPFIHLGQSPFGIAITPDGAKAYVCNNGNNNVSIIDTDTDLVIGQDISVGRYPFYIAIGPAPTIPSAPSKFIGKIERHSNSLWRKTSLFMKWKKTPTVHIDHYEIFASGRLIASIPASAPLKFRKRLQPYVRDERLSKKYLRFLHEKYRIRAVSIFGIASPFKKIEVAKTIITKNDLYPVGD